MYNSKYSSEEVETRSSMDPIFPPTAKLHDTDNRSSTVSIDVDTIKDTEIKPTRMERFKATLKILRPMAIMLFFDVGLPLAVYYILKIWLSILIALILSGIPPLLRVIYVFWKKRKVDILGCIFVVSFILSAVLSVISGDVRVTLLRDSTTTAIISVMFFITMIPLRTKWFKVRPLIYMFAQQMMVESPPFTWTDIEGEEHTEERMEWIWNHCSIFRKYCYILSAIWGSMLMGEFVAKVIMIKSSLTIDQIVIYGNIIVIVVIVVMTIGTTIASKIMRKRISVIVEEWILENDFSKKSVT